MTGEIIGAELVLRIETERFEVFCPCCEHVPVLCRVGGVLLVMADGSGEDDHVACLFYRHVTAIGLAVCDRICPDVMCRERLCPFAAFGIVIDVVHQTFREFWVVEEEEWRGRIGHVHSADGTVAVVLFGEPEKIAVGRLYELVGMDSLTIGKRAEFGIFLPSRLLGILHELLVELVTLPDE